MNLADKLNRLGDREATAHWLKVGTINDCASADYKAGFNRLKGITLELAEALEKISKAKEFTRLADCCVNKSCHINEETGTCSFQTGVYYGNCDRAAESDEALAKLEKELGDG